jgi:hypothetical protein
VNIDCILGHHLNPMTCGIAKFNSTLARRLGVPFLNIFDAEVRRMRRVLLSFKCSEFGGADTHRFGGWLDGLNAEIRLRLFLHAYDDTPIERRAVLRAETIYCGNELLARRLRDLNPRVVPLWCPGTNMRPEIFKPTELSVLSFGMAHKVRAENYLKLKSLLDCTGMTYVLYLSTALHEGTSFDDSFGEAFEQLEGIFGSKVYFLGYLSDQAVYNYLRNTTFFAAFFDGGVRANNTSVLSALQAASVVITNLDEHSPPEMRHLRNIVDINCCDALPTDPDELHAIGIEGKKLGMGDLGWDALVARFVGEPPSP